MVDTTGDEPTDAGVRTAAGRDAAPRDELRTDASAATSAGDAASGARPDASVPRDADSGAPPGLPTPNAPALTYLGTRGNDSTCNQRLRSVGYAPDDNARHPLFLYFVGTQFVSEDQSSYYDSDAVKQVTEAMARRGFVAYGVEYDNVYSSLLADKARCVYVGADSFLEQACALPSVDCSLGIATWGHSQGAMIAHAASNYDPRVRAVWTTGYGGNDFKLAKDRMRVVNAEGDPMNGTYEALNRAAGTSCSSGETCLRDDGSGWILVRKSDELENSGDHCWFDKLDCGSNAINLEPRWIDRTSSTSFALETNADWVAATVQR